jgi:hypothetical protein
MSSDPTRLFEANSEAPDVLRGLLQEARNVGPSAAQTARLAAKLGPAFGAVAGGSAFASLSGGVKLAAALAVTGAVAGGVLWYAPKSTAPSVALQQSARPTSATADTEFANPAAPVSVSTPTAVKSQAAAPAGKSPAHPAKVSEADLLERARTALQTNPAAALNLTREHAERFPKGVLSQEREIIAIDALSRLKRDGEASGRAADFKKRYPDSPHQRKLETLRK